MTPNICLIKLFNKKKNIRWIPKYISLNPISAGVLENQDKKFANLQKLNFLSQNPVKSSKNVCKKISNMQKFSQYFK